MQLTMRCLLRVASKVTHSFSCCSLSRLFEDALPLLVNNSLRERILRITPDYEKLLSDQQAWNDLLASNSSRSIQWRGYNLSGTAMWNINFLRDVNKSQPLAIFTI